MCIRDSPTTVGPGLSAEQGCVDQDDDVWAVPPEILLLLPMIPGASRFPVCLQGHTPA